MNARRLISTALVSLCTVVGALALGGVSAQAAITHDYLSQITEVPAVGPHGEAVPVPGPMEEVDSLTTDSGDVWVAEKANNPNGEFRVDEFNATTGAFVSQLPQVPGVGELRHGVAVGHATGEADTYVVGVEGSSQVVLVFGATGSLLGKWTGGDTPTKAFGCLICNGEVSHIAVDNSPSLGDWAAGDVYVADTANNVIDVFQPESEGKEKLVAELKGVSPSEPFISPSNVAISDSNGDVVVLDQSGVGIFKPAPLPGQYEFLGKLNGPPPSGSFGAIHNLAVDGSDGDIYVAEQNAVDEFSSTGAYLGRITGEGTPAGSFDDVLSVAVSDSVTHRVFVGDYRQGKAGNLDVFGPNIVVPDVSTEPAVGVKPRSGVLEGTVNPDEAEAGGPATCRFEWGTSVSFGHVAPCEPEVAEGNSPVAVHAAVSGLQMDTTYYYRLVASNKSGTNPGEAWQDQEFTTSGPGIHQEAASVVTSISATLGGAVDPNNASTSCYFEYGTSTGYGSIVPAPPGLGVGSSKGDVAMNVHLQGLAAGTVYHYRVVALSEVEGEPVTVEGPDETFMTQGPGTEFTLPDGRAWEMVSPPNKQGASIYAIGNEGGDDIQAAVDGGGITYGVTSPFVANPAGSRSSEVTQVISTRGAPGSWQTSDIETPHNEGAKLYAVGHAAEYKLFSTDLSLGLVEPADDTPLPPLPVDAERTLYLREASGAYRALVTSENVPPGTKFGNNAEENSLVNFVSASPNFSGVVLSSSLKLTSAPKPVSEGPGLSELFEWVGGRLQLASVLPNGESTDAVLGSSSEEGYDRHAISSDGSRLVWQAHSHSEGSDVSGHLYMRDMLRGETVPVDAAKGMPEPTQRDRSQYRTASSDDSRVFFTSPERLTSNSTAENGQGENVGDLYVFEVTSGAGEPLAGKLTDLTVDPNAGETAAVQGVIEASEDGSYVYFVANGVLGDGGEHGATAGANNLYVVHYDEAAKAWGAPTFIAALAEGDRPSWNDGRFVKMTSRVSPNGRYLAFMSERSLTGYENRDANSGVLDEEVFLYDAETGRLVCASCDPTGARPVGETGSTSSVLRLWDEREIWTGRWVAGSLPGWTPTDLVSALYQSRYLSNNGRLFFDSSDALVPADVNGQEDVYEYEPAGIGSCQGPGYGVSGSVVFSEATGGCVGLISAGTSSGESTFMDASETGGDVFFLTLSRLAPQDYDTSLDIYDAHECTALVPCAPPAALVPPPCATGDACKAAPTPQPTLFGAPSSETFSGAGNIVPSASEAVMTRVLGRSQKLAKALRACRSKRRRERADCIRQARRRYGAKGSRVGKSLSKGHGR